MYLTVFMAAATIDDSWEKLGTVLYALNLDGTNITGGLPGSWGQAFSDVTFMSLAYCGLESELPLGTCTNPL